MATITFEYDARNSLLQTLIEAMQKAGAKISGTNNAVTYSPKFIKMITEASKAPKRELTSELKHKYFGNL